MPFLFPKFTPHVEKFLNSFLSVSYQPFKLKMEIVFDFIAERDSLNSAERKLHKDLSFAWGK
ncbi:hypothetical protein DVA43_16460 [Leclercia sp. W6]|nr:hypothetical protein DVA43_16460 [Leclercia sp. W6]